MTSKLLFALAAITTFHSSTFAQSADCTTDAKAIEAVNSVTRQLTTYSELQRERWRSYLRDLDAKALAKRWSTQRKNEVMLSVMDSPYFKSSQEQIVQFENQVREWQAALKSVENRTSTIRAACELVPLVLPASSAMLQIRLAQYDIAFKALSDAE
jgi:hypothetical protein